ncbi:4-hydroxythreonine-4-phosphate dehydrogenase PdxA, partial [Escherichia coli]|nr:4-hydroxythreonine-4-phosphate dehydrogenase PdxA [Escherichia coli]
MERKPVLGIFLGEAAGIGPELVAKVVADGTVYKYCRPVLIGDARVLALGQKIAGVHFQWNVISDPTEADWTTGNVPLLDLKNFNPEKLTMGTIDTDSGYATGESLVTCMSLLKSGKIDGFVFAPLNKEAFKKGGWDIEDEHYLFAEQLGYLDKPRGLLNVLGDLWVFRVTGHIPFKDIASHITPENVSRSIQLCYDTLRMAAVENPRIAVAALNPHAGD